MTEEDLIRLARENVEAWNAGDWQRLKAALAPDVVYDEVGSQRRMQGADQFVRAYQGWKKAVPDGKGKITNSVAADNTVVIEVTWMGTHNGPLETPGGTIPPSGKSWNLRGAQVVVLKDGKIKEVRQYFDMMTLLQQIGAVPK